MNKLSVVISAHNEEKKIKDCLESVKWADEILLLNNASTDKTEEVAKRTIKDIRILTQKNDPLAIDLQKNLGIEKATGNWILILDADERVTPELTEEIKRKIEDADKEINGYWMPRKNIIFGQWIKHTGWYPDLQLRLFRQGQGKFQQKHVHEPIHIKGQTAELKANLLHENYETISQFLHKTITNYAPNEAEEKLKQGYTFHWQDAIQFPLKEFLSRYFAREGYKDGFHGLMLSFLMAFYHFIIFANLWEKSKFTSPNLQLSDVESEFKKSQKQINYWLTNEKLKTEKNPVKKILLKGERRLH